MSWYHSYEDEWWCCSNLESAVFYSIVTVKWNREAFGYSLELKKWGTVLYSVNKPSQVLKKSFENIAC